MESTKFDELTKALATSTSRRQALKVFAGSLGAAAAAVLGSGIAAAAPPSPCSPNPCRPGQTCCVINGNKAICCKGGTTCQKNVGCVKP